MSDAVSQAAKDKRERRLREGPQCTCDCPYVRMQDNVWVCRFCGNRSLPGGRENTQRMRREFYLLLRDDLGPHRLVDGEAPVVIRLLEQEGFATLEYVHDDVPYSYVRIYPTARGEALIQSGTSRRGTSLLHGDPPLEPKDTETPIVVSPTFRDDYIRLNTDPERAELFARVRHALKMGIKGDYRGALSRLTKILDDILGKDDIAIPPPTGVPGNYTAEIQAIYTATLLLNELRG